MKYGKVKIERACQLCRYSHTYWIFNYPEASFSKIWCSLFTTAKNFNITLKVTLNLWWGRLEKAIRSDEGFTFNDILFATGQLELPTYKQNLWPPMLNFFKWRVVFFFFQYHESLFIYLDQYMPEFIYLFLI